MNVNNIRFVNILTFNIITCLCFDFSIFLSLQCTVLFIMQDVFIRVVYFC